MSTINFPSFDPNLSIEQHVRALSGPIKTGTVTYDEAYQNNENARWLYFFVTGNVSYTKWDGTVETLGNIAAGVWHPIPSMMINESGTTIAADQIRWGS